MSKRIFKTLLLAGIFGSLSGLMVAVLLGVFIPEFFNEWTGKLVCGGRVEYMPLKRTYFCYTSANDYYDLGDAMFWAVFNRFVLPALTVGFLMMLGFMLLTESIMAKKKIEL